MEGKKKENFWSKVKLIFFLVIVLLIAHIAMAIWGNGKITALEGYLYSFADDEYTSTATYSDATSSNVNTTTSTSPTTTTTTTTTTTVTTSPSPSTSVTTNAVQEEVAEEEEEIVTEVEYTSTQLTSTIISNIANDENIKTIKIDASNSSNISSELFSAIQGTEKELIITYDGNEIIFYGKDITSIKAIDAEIETEEISSDKTISEILEQDGIVINFAENGTLPGTATVRLKITDEIEEQVTETRPYIYFFDEEEENFTQITKAKLNDEYYEFEIEHNSKYVLVDEEIDETLLAGYVEPVENNVENEEEPEEETVSFLESHKVYIIIIAVCVVVIIVVAIIIIVNKRKKSKNKNSNDEEALEDISEEDSDTEVSEDTAEEDSDDEVSEENEEIEKSKNEIKEENDEEN